MGALGEGRSDLARVAPWIENATEVALEVKFSQEASQTLSSLKGELLRDNDALRRTLVQCLESDPRPLYRWRRERHATSSSYEVQIDGIIAHCVFECTDDGNDRVTIVQFRKPVI